MRVALLSLLLSTVPSAFGYRAAAALQRTTTKPLVTTSPTFAEATFRKVATVQRTRPPVASVTVEEDYRVSAGFVAVGLVVLFAPWLIGGFSLVLGLFLVFQTLRIRFVFDDDAFEVKTKPLDGLFDDLPLTNTGENFAVGGENRWAYSSFVNYDFFPSEALPILVYFKETQTPADKWDVGPGQMANSEEALAKGAVKGQVHFFPCIAKADVLKEQFIAKGCAKLP